MTRTYLVECYWPGVSQTRLADTITRLAGEPGRSDGVRWLDSILVPADETVLCVFHGATAGAIRRAADQARLPAERVVPCIQIAANGRDRAQGRGSE